MTASAGISFHQVLANRYLEFRIFRQRNTDRIPDAIFHQGADADGRFDPAVFAVTGFALTWMHAVNAQRPVSTRLVPAALLLKASALAARQVPEVNGFYTEARFRPSPVVHLGVAVALREGGDTGHPVVLDRPTDAAAVAIDAIAAQLATRGRGLAGRKLPVTLR